MPSLSSCSRAKRSRVAAPRHRAVFVQDLDDDGGRVEARQAREVATRFRVAGAGQYAARLSHQGENMAGLAQVLGARAGPHRGADGVRAILRGDPGRDPFRRLDRDGEVRAVLRIRAGHHQGQPQLLAALAGQRQADQAAAVARHEVDVLGAHARGRHDEVALVLAVLVVHDHDHAAGAQVGEDFIDRVEAGHARARPGPGRTG